MPTGSELVKLERLVQDINMNGFYNDTPIWKWYIEFVHSFTIHTAGWESTGKRMRDPVSHDYIFNLVSYNDDISVMLNCLNNYKGWGLRVHHVPTSYTGSTTLVCEGELRIQNNKKKRNKGGIEVQCGECAAGDNHNIGRTTDQLE